MKKIPFRRVLAVLFALVLCMSLAAPAFAVDTSYTPVSGTTTTFQKALILDENANVPDISFAYSIAAGTAVPASAGVVEIISPSAATGVTGSPTIGVADYNPGDATVTSAGGVTVDSGEKASLKTLTVDFTGVTFSEPGIYRYVITETSAGQQGVSYDTQADTAGQKTRVLDVYVTDNNGSLQIEGYVLMETAVDVSADADTLGSDEYDNAIKSVGFVNEFATFDLTVANNVAGNQGSRDKYFEFTIEIENAGANTNLDVDWSGAVGAQNAVKAASTVYAAADMQTANQADDNTGSSAVPATEWYVDGDTEHPYGSQAAAEAAVADPEFTGAGVITDNGVAATTGIEGNQWVTDGTGAVTKTVYLKHGQQIVIKGLPSGATYTVTENNEDYIASTSQTKGSADPITEDDNNEVEEATGMAADHVVAFTNTRSGAVPTGIMMSVLPGVAVLGLGAAGLAFGASKKNKKDQPEA